MSVALAKVKTRAAPVPLAGLYDATKKRKQNIRTPEWFLAGVLEAFGGYIPLDPCAHRNQRHWFAHTNWTAGGRSRPWEEKTYANPPFGGALRELVYWLAHARVQAAHTGLPTIVLAPWRSHRHHFMPALAASTVIWFRAFPFAGHKNSTPFPCVAIVRHCKFPRLELETGRADVPADGWAA